MHPIIAGWILEYFIREPLDDEIVDTLLCFLPPVPDQTKLLTLLLIKKLETEISRHSVSKSTLQLLEQLEQLERERGNEAADTMKSAYCAVAVDLTVKVLREGAGCDKEKNIEFFETVKSIWQQRIGKIKDVERGGLGSEQLWKWKDEFVAAVWSDGAAKSVVKNSEAVNAVEAVNAYVLEEKTRMGPSTLERFLEELSKDVDENNASKEMQGGGVKLREKIIGLQHVTGSTSGTSSSGAKAANSDERINGSPNRRYNVPSSAKFKRVVEALVKSRLELRAVVTDPLPEAIKIAEAVTRELRNDEHQNPADNNAKSNSFVLVDTGVVHETGAGAARGNTSNVSEPSAGATNGNKSNIPKQGDGAARATDGTTSKVPKPSDGAARATDGNKGKSLMERNSSAHIYEWEDSIDESSQDDQAGPSMPAPKKKNTSRLDRNKAGAKKRRKCQFWSSEDEEALREAVNDQAGPSMPAAKRKNTSRLDRNKAGAKKRRKCQVWSSEDEEALREAVNDQAGPSMPARKRRNTSRLNRNKAAAKNRRERQFWSAEDVEALRKAVEEHGKGNWKKMLIESNGAFVGRTEVDLKDKWRNMTKVRDK